MSFEDFTYEKGDKIHRKEKLSPWYVGRYEVLQWFGKVAYELKLPSELASVHLVFHVTMLNKCIGDPISILPI